MKNISSSTRMGTLVSATHTSKAASLASGQSDSQLGSIQTFVSDPEPKFLTKNGIMYATTSALASTDPTVEPTNSTVSSAYNNARSEYITIPIVIIGFFLALLGICACIRCKRKGSIQTNMLVSDEELNAHGNHRQLLNSSNSASYPYFESTQFTPETSTVLMPPRSQQAEKDWVINLPVKQKSLKSGKLAFKISTETKRAQFGYVLRENLKWPVSKPVDGRWIFVGDNVRVFLGAEDSSDEVVFGKYQRGEKGVSL